MGKIGTISNQNRNMESKNHELIELNGHNHD